MGSLLVVDGSGVCRAPIMAFTLGEQLAAAGWPFDGAIEARGLAAEAGRTMCENAAARIGYSGPAIAYFGAYRAIRLSIADLRRADLVITAERTQRSAVVRMLPGTQASVFTVKEAVTLAHLIADRARIGTIPPPTDLAALARALHGARGMVPLIEPPVRTGPFHWRRTPGSDPLTIEAGHAVAADHRRVTQESRATAVALAQHLADVVQARIDPHGSPAQPARTDRLRRSA